MDQIKIGNFIAKCRKNKKLTQNELAEKLNITDKAISKWETGKSMPDSSIMLELCQILNIDVNELLNGEKSKNKLNQKEYSNTIIELINERETKNKNLILSFWTILISTSLLYVVILILLTLFKTEINHYTYLIATTTIIYIISNLIGLNFETKVGYYECQKCHHKFKPTYKETLFTMHLSTIRYLKCPNCKKHNWTKKIIKNN